MEIKTCIKCNEQKELVEFEKRSDTGKYRNQCKKCRNNYVNKYRTDIQNGSRSKKEIVLVDNKKQCIHCKEWKDLSEYPKRHDINHGHRHDCNTCHKKNLYEYYINVYNEVRRERKLNDIEYRLICNHRNYIYKCLTKFNNKKDKSLRYLDCTLSNFKKWLEFQFDDDMTWDNYGKLWTIDHILPLSSFDLNEESEQKIAFNWKNMQPSKDNFEKGKNIRLYEYFNSLISAHRYINNESLDKREYQGLRESLNWLRTKLRYGNNLIAEA